MDLTIQQLRVVLAVRDAESFTLAAQRLRLAQSSTSRTVRDVEDKLGTPLFARTTRNLVSTAEGVEFARVARYVVDCFDAGMSHFDGYLAGATGRVRIAALPSLAAILLPPVIAAYRSRRPDVEVAIEDGLSGEVLTRVRSGDVDLAVTVPPEPLDDLDVRPIARDHFCCVHPRAHRFSELDRVNWSELEQEPYIAFDPTSSIRRHADEAFRDARVQPDTVVEARNVAAVAGLVAAGLGVTVVPGLVLPLVQFANLSHRALDPTTSRQVAIVRSPQRPTSPAANDFVTEMERARRADVPLATEAEWLPQ